MVAGSCLSRKRLSAKNGFAPRTNGFTSREGKNGSYDPEIVDEFEETPFYVAVMTYFTYFFLIIFGYLRDFTRKYGVEKSKASKESGNQVRKYLKFKDAFPQEANGCSFTCQVNLKNI